MARLGKNLCLCLVVILAVSSLLMVKPTNAQTIPAPSVPQFTIETIDSSYDVPSTAASTTNPYTGEVTTTTTPSYHVENITTYIKIKNQPFTPYQMQQDTTTWINLFYNIEIKGHYTAEWRNYRFNNGSSDRNLVQDHSSQFTIVPINDYLPEEGEVDFRVQALEGYQHGVGVFPGIPGQSWIITGSASDWSPTQTITIPADSVSPSPTVPEFPFLLVIPLLLSVLAVVCIMRKKQLSHRVSNMR